MECTIDIRKKSQSAIKRDVCSCDPGTTLMKIHQKFEYGTADFRYPRFDYSPRKNFFVDILDAIYLGGQKIAKTIGNRKLKVLPRCVGKYRDLTILDVDGVGMENLDAIYGKKSLLTLKLRGNNVKDLENIPDGLDNLERLTISNDSVERITSLDRFPNLHEIDLSGNQIEKIEGLSKLHELEELNLNRNKIKRIENLRKNENLTRLFLNRNKIKELGDVTAMESLEIVDLRNNKLKGSQVDLANSLIDRGTRVETGGVLKSIVKGISSNA